MKVMIVVTHLLGTGHLTRAALLARGMSQEGAEVLLVSGGMPAAHLDQSGLRVVQLPPLRSDGVDFTRLMDADGAPASDRLKQARRDLLLESFTREKPDALVTELFPFGRRMLRDEFGALLELAFANRCAVAASVRDILNPPSTKQKADWADEMLSRYYDAVLIHADPDVVRLAENWPESPAIAKRSRYTGFVAPPPPVPIKEGTGEILVSAGGGPVGDGLFDAACQAAALDSERHWRLFVGGVDAHARIARLQAKAPMNLRVHPTRPEFRNMLCNAAASVSFCGYNTALDLLQSGVPAILVPFDEGGEVEQRLRATALARLEGIDMIESGNLSGESLIGTLEKVCSAPRRAPRLHGLNGARKSGQILATMVRETRT